jgi:ATP-dependent DNA ligase
MLIKDRFDSSSSSAKYDASYDTETGKGSCNCPGWTRRAVRECKHTKDLAARAAKQGAPKIEAKPDPVTEFDRVQDSGAQPPTIKPMLASAMKEAQTMADFYGSGYVMEEKFDGHRLMVVVAGGKATAWSRPGDDKPALLRPLPASLVAQLVQLPEGQYDGELMVPGGTSSDVTRLDRKEQLVYVIFDAVILMGQDITERTQAERRALLEVAVAHAQGAPRVKLATQGPVSMETVKAIWAMGGEGAIIKKLDSTYRSGWRTPNWIKVKQIGAAELTITGYEAAVRGPHSCFKLRHDDGRETTVKVLTDELLRAVDANPDSFIGRRVVISYMGLTTSGTWRHPIFDHFAEVA